LLSETLAAGLEQYRIGEKVRALRLGKKLGLAELGAHTGLSTALLSKIERGRLFPTLPTLLRIALVFGVGLEHFFSRDEGRQKIKVIRKTERLRLPDTPDSEPPCYLFESLDFTVTHRKAEVYYAEFPMNSRPSAPHRHPGTELIYLVAGRLAVNVDGEDVLLDRGDAASFDANLPHSYRREGRAETKVIVVTAPGAGQGPN
jgi:transcriptional regulator with XRE-family HTH domain